MSTSAWVSGAPYADLPLWHTFERYWREADTRMDKLRATWDWLHDKPPVSIWPTVFLAAGLRDGKVWVYEHWLSAPNSPTCEQTIDAAHLRAWDKARLDSLCDLLTAPTDALTVGTSLDGSYLSMLNVQQADERRTIIVVNATVWQESTLGDLHGLAARELVDLAKSRKPAEPIFGDIGPQLRDSWWDYHGGLMLPTSGPPDGGLLPIDGGFMDRRGRIVFGVGSGNSETALFTEGLAPVLIGERVGYVDEKWRWAIEPRFVCADNFHGGVARVGLPDLEHGMFLIDRHGERLFEDGFDVICAMHEGRAAAARDDRWGHIDPNGRIVTPLRYGAARAFCEGLAAVKFGGGAGEAAGYRGFVDRHGGEVIEPRFHLVGDFRAGLAPAAKSGKWGYIDRTGRWIIEPRFAHAHRFSEGLAAVRVGDQWGFIDRHGESAFERRFDRVDEAGFQEGRAVVGRYGAESFCEQYGYIDRTGQVVIDMQYGWAEPFCGGRASVWASGAGPALSGSASWGVIDPNGRELIGFRLEGPVRWGEGGLGVVCTDGPFSELAYYINEAGERVGPEPWD